MKKRRSSISLIILFVSLVVWAGSLFASPDTSLPRSTLLGIVPEQNQPGSPVTLQQVIKNSTAAALGLQQGDVITHLNDQTIADFPSLLNAIRPLKPDAPVQVQIKRKGTHLTLAGKMQPRPYETSKYAKVLYESVKYPGNHLRSIVYQPTSLTSAQKAPAILFIQGYTCDSIDYGLLPDVTTRQMIDQFAEAGYVVYRIEKPGVGDSVSERPCQQINFSEEAQAFVQGLKALKGKDYVDPENVYIFGHSLGVLHAPVVASQEPVRGIIGYGGVYKQWYEYMLDIYQKQTVKHWGTSPEQAKRTTRRLQPLLDAWLNTDKPWQEILNDPQLQQAINSNMISVDGDLVISRHYSFFRDINQIDFASLWKTLNIPVLMMHGSLDIQAIEPQWAFDLADQTGHASSQAMVLEGAEHAFMRFESKQQHMKVQRSGQYNPGNPQQRFDPRVGQHTLDWIAKIQGDSGKP